MVGSGWLGYKWLVVGVRLFLFGGGWCGCTWWVVIGGGWWVVGGGWCCCRWWVLVGGVVCGG